MRKIFTIAAAMLLGASAFTANAQTSTVDFYFQDDEDVFSIDDPYQYVTIWNDTDSESVDITGNWMQFSYSTTTILRISPEDLDYEIRVSVNDDADTGSYDLDKEETQYYLTLYPGAEGLEVTVKVYPEGSAPADGAEYEELTANFIISSTGENKVDDPYQYVKISYNSGNEVEIEDNYPSATLPKGAVVSVSAEEGYLITNVSTFGNAGECSGPNSDGSWNININNTLTEDSASFFISVESDPTSGVNALNAVEEGAEIYSIQGLKVNKANITNGLYIINGQKVYINK